MHPRRITITAALLVAGLIAGCGSGDESASEKREEPRPPGSAPVTAFAVDLGDTAIRAGSPYVEGLCSIDYFDPGDLDDPIGWLTGQIEALPLESEAEAEEAAWIVESLRRSIELEDPFETDDLSAVAAILAARCSP